MRHFKIKWSNLFYNLMVALFIAFAVGVNPVYAAAASVAIGAALGAMPYIKQSAFFMAIQKEIWENDIVEGLWGDNQFLQNAFNADEYVLQGKVVHIPQAGTAPGVSKNRSSLPATVTKRTDVDITYALDEFTSDPVHIPDADTVELSYNKRNSVLSETRSAINNTIALHMIYGWLPSDGGRIIRTDGDAVAAHLPSATGDRLAMTPGKLKEAMTKFNSENVPGLDRFAMMDAVMYEQFIDSLTESQYRDFSRAFDEKTGVVGMLYSFKILVRDVVGIYTNAATPVKVAPGTTGAATHNAAALCWQKNSVERALGDVKFFENIGDPTYYGDIYSGLVRMGGRIRRNDNKGVLAIVQAASA